MTLVTRPDLSRRTALSKSQLMTAEMCGHKAWFDIHERQPLIPAERITFGSAVDAAIEQVIAAGGDGGTLPLQAAAEVAERDAVEIDFTEVERAIDGFRESIVPQFDFKDAVTQANINIEIEGLGASSGHPDIILANGSVFDVKTAARVKDENVAASLELGFYALLAEASGLTVPEVGFITWVRVKRPWWQVVRGAVTDEMRRHTRARASAFVRARDLDLHVNEGVKEPVNYTLISGPKGSGMCATCQYSPANGGRCEIATWEDLS